jgi:hypothetical protein
MAPASVGRAGAGVFLYLYNIAVWCGDNDDQAGRVTHGQWLAIAARRLQRNLDRLRYASIRQLEMKISEAGPPHQRPSPIHLREALEGLVWGGHVAEEPPPAVAGLSLPTFYSPSDFSLDDPDDAARRALILALYQTFLETNREEQGKTLERATFTAALEARSSGQFVAVLGSPDRPPGQGLVLDGIAIGAPVDLILLGLDGSRVAVEEKNYREWLGPKSHEVWELFGKAVRLDALPVLICRKVTYDLFLLFKQTGALAFQVHSQLFHERFTERLATVKHKDGLGFADIRFGDTPSPALRRFLGITLPRLLPNRIAIFRRYLPLLRDYAIERRLEEDLSGSQRNIIYGDFFRTLKGWENHDEQDETTDDDDDNNDDEAERDHGPWPP